MMSFKSTLLAQVKTHFSGTPAPFFSVKRTNVKPIEANSNRKMHQYENIHIGTVVMNNKIKFKCKCISIDYFNKLYFKPWAAFHNTSMNKMTKRVINI